MPATHVDFGLVQRTRPGRTDAGSAIAASAYNLCSAMCHGDRRFDFRRKRTEHVGGDVLLPLGAPPAFKDPANLWHAVEAMERRADAQVARQVLVSLPRGCPPELRLDLAREIAHDWVNDGMAVQIDVHVPTAADGGQQPHVHFLLTLRRVTDRGLAATKERAWNNRFREDKGRVERRRIAAVANQFLVAHDVADRLDPERRDDHLSPEPCAPRRDWLRWKRDPEDTPAAVAAVFAHRANRRLLDAALRDAATAAAEIQSLSAVAAGAAEIQPVRAPKKTEETIMARRPQRTTARANNPKTNPSAKNRALPTGTWTQAEGGLDALSDRNRRAAEAAFAEWSEGNPRAAEKYGLGGYVSYVQNKRRAEEDVAETGDVEQPGDTRSATTAQDGRQAEASRVRQREALLADRYMTPAAVADHVQSVRIDRAGQFARLTLKGGGELRDHGNRVEHDGAVSPEAAAAVVAAAAAHGWDKLAIAGNDDFKNAIAVAAALRDPPITVDHPLPAAAVRQVAEARVQRAVAAVRPLDPGALAEATPADAARAFASHVEARVQAAAAGRPSGSTTPAALAETRLADLRERVNGAREMADEALAASDAHRSRYPLTARLLDPSARRRQAALDREADRLSKVAERLERREPRERRRIESSARREALANASAIEDWRWSPAGRAAERQAVAVRALRHAIEAGDEPTIAAAAKGDLRSSLAAADAAFRPAVPTAVGPPEQPQDPRAQAVAILAGKETGLSGDALATARVATAAAVAGDENVVAAAMAGDPVAVRRAADEWRKREENDRRAAQADRDRRLHRAAANNNEIDGP